MKTPPKLPNRRAGVAESMKKKKAKSVQLRRKWWCVESVSWPHESEFSKLMHNQKEAIALANYLGYVKPTRFHNVIQVEQFYPKRKP